MRCLEFRTAVALPGDVERSESLTAKLQQNMKQCPDCRRYARQMEGLGRLLKQLPQPTLPEGFTAAVCLRLGERAPRRGLRAWYQRQFGWLRKPTPLLHPVLALTAAAVCLAVATGFITLHAGGPPPPVGAGEVFSSQALTEMIGEHDEFVADQPLGDDSGFQLVSHSEAPE